MPEDGALADVEDDTDFSPDNFSFDFGGDFGADDEIAFPAVVETADGLPGDDVEAGRLHDSRRDAGATKSELRMPVRTAMPLATVLQFSMLLWRVRLRS